MACWRKWKYRLFLFLGKRKNKKKKTKPNIKVSPASVCKAVVCNEVMLSREKALVVSSVIYESLADVAKEMVDSVCTAVHVNTTVYLCYTKKVSNIPWWCSIVKIDHDFSPLFSSITPLPCICQTYHELQNYLTENRPSEENNSLQLSYIPKVH